MSSLDRQTSSPGLQGLASELGPGLVALVGGSGPFRSQILEQLAVRLTEGDERLATLVAGHGLAEPAKAWRRVVRVLAQCYGLDGVDTELLALQDGRREKGGEVTDPSVGTLRARVHQLRRLPEAVRTKEREIRGLRADEAEVSGDMEVAKMDWLRERQDAETNLLAYRDRARELKLRLQQLEEGGFETACPTCDRLLGERFASVVTGLREEWESVVQDGSWWKRRRQQLDFKPSHLQELEGRAILLQAAIERHAEELERLRARLPELAEAEDTLLALGSTGASSARESSARPRNRGQPHDENKERRRRTLEALRERLIGDAEHSLAARAGRYLNRLTGGGVLGIGLTADGEPTVVRDEGSRRPNSDEEVAAYLFALRLALIDLGADHRIAFEEVLLGDTFDRLEPEMRIRAAGLLRSLLSRVPKILLFCRGDVLEAIPESFDWIVDLAVDRTGAPRTAIKRSGVGKLRVH